MLAERSSTSDARLDFVNTIHNTPFISGTTSIPIMENQDTGNSYHSRLYLGETPSSGTDPRSGKSTSLPVGVVAPSASEREYGSDENSNHGTFIPARKQREFIPEYKKDDGYWEKRRKNNEAARRSREKRRMHDMVLENRIIDLTRDNCKLRNELILIKKKFGIPLDETFQVYEGDHPGAGPQHGVPLNNVTAAIGSAQQPPSILSSALQQRCPPSMQQSPVRRRNVSGAYPQPFVTSQYQTPPQENIYPSRVHSDGDLKLFSGKYDAQSSMKSINDQSLLHNMHGQSSPLTSSITSPHLPSHNSSLLQAQYERTYFAPALDMTSSDSNDEGDWNDPVQEQPLSLVKKRPSTENESGSEFSNNSSRASNSPPFSSPTSALPHKLRHKQSQEYQAPAFPSQIHTPYTNGLTQLSELALAHSNLPLSGSDDYPPSLPMESYKIRPRSYSNPRSVTDEKYVERRRKNNEAARKCRENRKALTKIREVKSGYLENENGKLKDELKGLQEEMRELRDLLDKKRQLQENVLDDTEIISGSQDKYNENDDAAPMEVKTELEDTNEKNGAVEEQ